MRVLLFTLGFVVLVVTSAFFYFVRDFEVSPPTLRASLVYIRYPYGICAPYQQRDCFQPFEWNDIIDATLFFTDTELESMNKSTCSASNACCVGAISVGGGNNWAPNEVCSPRQPNASSPQRYKVNYMRRFVVKGRDFLFGMADVVDILPNNSRIAFIGDSVSHQVFDGTLCDLARSGHVNITNYTGFTRHTKLWMYGSAVRFEVDLLLAQTKTIKLIFHREYRFSKDQLTIKEICHNATVVVFNYGVHWNVLNDFQTDVVVLVAALKKHCLERGVKVIFRGTTSQHFLRNGGSFAFVDRRQVPEYLARVTQAVYPQRVADFVVNNETSNDLFDAGCERIVFSDFEKEYDWRNYVVLRALYDAGLVVLITPWGEPKSGCVKYPRHTVFYIPFGEVTMSLYDQHATECTHYCGSPQFWAPVFDGIYLALRQADKRLCDTAVLPTQKRGHDIVSPVVPAVHMVDTPNYQIPELPGEIYK